jgi:hypothetical protein
MRHNVSTLVDEELNIVFCLFWCKPLLFISWVPLWSLLNAALAIHFMVQICRLQDAHNWIPNNLTNIHLMYNNKLLFFYSRFVVQPPQNIQDEGSYVFKGSKTPCEWWMSSHARSINNNLNDNKPWCSHCVLTHHLKVSQFLTHMFEHPNLFAFFFFFNIIFSSHQ